MKALVWTKSNNSFDLLDKAEPQILCDDQVKIKILEVGVCGTDRDEVHAGRGQPPKGEDQLIIGHEMLGRVVEVGHLVTKVKPGDLAIFTVRRGCGQCPACDYGSYDMCYTGKYTERGIKERHGFQSEFVVDRQKYLVKVPEELKEAAVLCEPTSIVEKAIDLAGRIQRMRLPDWGAEDEQVFRGRRVLVAGVGAHWTARLNGVYP